jgi:hypothetical protein
MGGGGDAVALGFRCRFGTRRELDVERAAGKRAPRRRAVAWGIDWAGELRRARTVSGERQRHKHRGLAVQESAKKG